VREFRAWTITTPVCLTGIALCTWISFRLHQNLAATGFLYLIFVVLAALHGGFWQATLMSVISVACLDFFFDEPIFSFTVGRGADWVELGAFEFTALIVSRLSNREQIRAAEALANRRDTTHLYETARRILLIGDYVNTASLVVQLVRQEFDLHSAFLFDPRSAKVHESGDPYPESNREQIIEALRNTYYSDKDGWDEPRRIRYCVLRLGARPMGALALCGTEMNGLNASAVASLCAIALERARSLETACHAEAASEAEKLRAAVLDALAHKFKTPLTVIRTALAGVPAAGPLSPLQADLVTLIDQVASKLNDLSHRVVGGHEGDSRDGEPQVEPLLLSLLMKTSVEELEEMENRDRFRFLVSSQEAPVLADRELILTALAQLVDNALKYSDAGSPIQVAVSTDDRAVVLSVRSRGLVVDPADRDRIFERFYRANEARVHAPGSGLGLSIVRTIASDHRGHVWAEGEPGYGTTFFLSLPLPQKALA
jgi:two-component system sensor histidine kinase KdpD